MRIFVGIDIPEHIKNDLNMEADKFLKLTQAYKKIPKDNYHLTLKFIGEIDLKQIDDLNQILKTNLETFKPFEVELKDLGFFKKKDGLILWLGVLKGIGMLKSIHKTLDPILNQTFNLEKAVFSPHVTLAKKLQLDDETNLRKNKTQAYHFTVDEIHIFYSHMVDETLTYTKMSSIKL